MKRLLPLIVSWFLRGLYKSLRIRHVRQFKIDNTPQYVLAFWHAHLLLMVHARFRRPMSALVSQSRDGEAISRVFDRFDIKTSRGSSNRGGSAGLRDLLRQARNGDNIAISPDGPTGPPRIAKEGVILAAQASGLPIMPVAFAAERKKLLRSWDRMIVPLPFTRALFLYGDPIAVPRRGDSEEWRTRLEGTLNDMAAEAENKFDELWNEDPSKT